MRKSILIYFVFFTQVFIYAQKSVNEFETDANGNIIIYCNTSNNTNLFFKYPIDSGTLGSQNFQFGYDKENQGKIGILKGIKGPESNLLVTTTNGDIFSFIIRYKEILEKYNYFINSVNKIGNINGEEEEEEPNVKQSTPSEESLKIVSATTFNDYNKKAKLDNISVNRYSKETDSLYKNNPKEYYSRLASKVIDDGPFYKRYYAENNNVKLHLNNIVYNRGELYFYLTLENNSTIDYDIHFFKYYITSSNKKRKTSTQKIEFKPLYILGENSRVEHGTSKEFVYVFDKFTINKEKALEIEIIETTGERDLLIEVNNTNINNPNTK